MPSGRPLDCALTSAGTVNEIRAKPAPTSRDLLVMTPPWAVRGRASQEASLGETLPSPSWRDTPVPCDGTRPEPELYCPLMPRRRLRDLGYSERSAATGSMDIA